MALIPTSLGFEQEMTRRASLDRARLGQFMKLVLGHPVLSTLVQGVGTTVTIAATVVLILAQRALWEVIVASLVIQAAIVVAWWTVVPKPHWHGEWRAPAARIPAGCTAVQDQ